MMASAAFLREPTKIMGISSETKSFRTGSSSFELIGCFRVDVESLVINACAGGPKRKARYSGVNVAQTTRKFV